MKEVSVFKTKGRKPERGATILTELGTTQDQRGTHLLCALREIISPLLYRNPEYAPVFFILEVFFINILIYKLH